jgi:molecular chaperone DnaK (HSP70)
VLSYNISFSEAEIFFCRAWRGESLRRQDYMNKAQAANADSHLRWEHALAPQRTCWTAQRLRLVLRAVIESVRESTMAKIIRYIGIDFGTSKSAICYQEYDESKKVLHAGVEPVMVSIDKMPMVPTIVWIDEHGSPEHYGKQAEMFGYQQPDDLKENFLKENFKLDLESQNSDTRQEAKKLLSGFLSFLHEHYKGTKPRGVEIEEQTYISYPARWEEGPKERQKPEDIRQILVEAAQTAGFTQVQAMSEPRAAMQYFLTFEPPHMAPLKKQMQQLQGQQIIQDDKPLVVLLIDMGAGTTDLVLYQYVPGKPEDYKVLTTWPRAKESDESAEDQPGIFGGRVIDKLLAEHFNEFLKDYGQSLEDAWLWLESQCKEWKDGFLSPSLREDKSVHMPSSVSMRFPKNAKEKSLLINRHKLGEILREYLPVFPRLVNACIEDAVQAEKIRGGQDIDVVILTGGHSQWYFVKEILAGKWVPGLPGNPEAGSGVDLKKIRGEPHRILDGPTPEQTVAKGLALSGVLLKKPPSPPPPDPKKASTNVWVELKIENTWKYVQIVKMDESLPLHREMQYSYDFQYSPAHNNFYTFCSVEVGKEYQNRKRVTYKSEFTPLGFASSIARPFYEIIEEVHRTVNRPTFLTRRGKAYVYLEVDVDKNEKMSLLVDIYRDILTKSQIDLERLINKLSDDKDDKDKIDGTLASLQFSVSLGEQNEWGLRR